MTSVELSKHQPVQRGAVDSSAVNLSDDQQAYVSTLSNNARLGILKRMSQESMSFDEAVSITLTTQADTQYSQDLRAQSPNPGRSNIGSLASSPSQSEDGRTSRTRTLTGLFKRRKSSDGGDSAEKGTRRRSTLFAGRRTSTSSRRSNASASSLGSAQSAPSLSASPAGSALASKAGSNGSLVAEPRALPQRAVSPVVEENPVSKPARVLKPDEVMFQATVVKEIKTGAYDANGLQVGLECMHACRACVGGMLARGCSCNLSGRRPCSL